MAHINLSEFLLFDTHIDIPWQERQENGLPFYEEPSEDAAFLLETDRYFTFPKAQKGRMSAACIAAYTPQSVLNDAGHEAAWKRVCAMLERLRLYEARSEGKVRLCQRVEQIEEAHLAGCFSLIPVIENGYPIGEDLEKLRILSKKYGIAYMTLTHNGHNLLADSAIAKNEPEECHHGLSELGKEAIKLMNQEGILVDISHASKKTMMQAVSSSDVPILASHSCVRALCDHPRNLDDAQLSALKETGGMINITAMPSFLRSGGGGTLEDFITHLLYIVRSLGIEYAGISSDFDGGGTIKGWKDASESFHLIDALKKAGFDKSEITALIGGNMCRLMRQAKDYARSFV